MTLLRKFAILLGLLALTVVVGLGAALLFGIALERAVSEPFRSTTRVLTDLGGVKRGVSALEAEIVAGRAQDVDARLRAVRDDMASATDEPVFESLVGAMSAHNLERRVAESAGLAREWARSPDSERAELARASLATIHGLI